MACSMASFSSCRHYGARVGGLSPARRRIRTCCSLASSGSVPAGEPYRGVQVEERRKLLLKYVNEVQPQVMEQFTQQAPPQVVGAMKQTITNLLGTLPAQFFTVTINTMGETLAQLMYSVIMTGYMFRNVQFRLELRRSLGALPSSTSAGGGALPVLPAVTSASAAPQLVDATAADDDDDDDGYAPGTQKRVQGEVLRWHRERGLERVPAAEYIEVLEARVAALQRRVAGAAEGAAPLQAAAGDDARNEVLEYVRTLDQGALQELTGAACVDTREAMQSFIHRLLGTDSAPQLRSTSSECSAAELGKLVFWLLVVGYTLRSMEVRFDMESAWQGPPGWGPPELPPGR